MLISLAAATKPVQGPEEGRSRGLTVRVDLYQLAQVRQGQSGQVRESLCQSSEDGDMKPADLLAFREAPSLEVVKVRKIIAL
jgi:hypothetical protein